MWPRVWNYVAMQAMHDYHHGHIIQQPSLACQLPLNLLLLITYVGMVVEYVPMHDYYNRVHVCLALLVSC